MKKVLLLGDSIRMGYDDYVKEALDGKCEVVYDAEDNGRFAAYTHCGGNKVCTWAKVSDFRQTRCSSITAILTWYTGTTATGI